jgi:hypothetical protein
MRLHPVLALSALAALAPCCGALALFVPLAAIVANGDFDHVEAFAAWDKNKDGTITKHEYFTQLLESDTRCVLHTHTP